MELRRQHRIGAVLWCVGLSIALIWGGFRWVHTEAVGIGFSPPVQVAPLEAGRLSALQVGLHDVVRADDVVATIDPRVIEAERELAQATLLATRDRLGIELATESRRFAESAEGSMLTRAQLRAAIREDEATLKTLQERLSIEQGLVSRGAVSGLTADDVQWQMEVVAERLRANRQALSIADAAAANAEHRNADAPGLNQWEMMAAARAVELVERRRELYALTAGIDGHVTNIYASPGSMVSEGYPVLEVRSVATRDVVAYVSPAQVPRLLPGAEVTVVRASGEALSGHLMSIGGTPQMLPLPLWPWPQYPKFGVPVRIELDQGAVAPDEPVRVRL